LHADHYNGLVTEGTATHNARVSSVDPASDLTKVVVTDCSDSTHWLKYYVSNGEPANGGPGGCQQFRRLLRGEGIVLRLGPARAAAPTAA
jgi:hypothetical protein